MAEIYGLHAYSPKEIARQVEEVGVSKVRAPFVEAFMLGVLAGGFIGLGGLYYTYTSSLPGADSSGAAFLGGVVFATGYLVATLAGAEVFTSNNLQAMTWAARRISTWELARHWAVVLVANLVGAFGIALLFLLSDLPGAQGGRVGERALEIAVDKASLSLAESFFLGILGNLFVCLAAWVSLAGRTVTDKVVGMLLPLSAVAAVGLEHVVASLYYLPRGLLLMWSYPEIQVSGMDELTGIRALRHLLGVTAGNIFGGSFMVALVYYVVYRRHPDDPSGRG